ncbi:30S ribosomal protein S1 [Bordetella pertussis]|uniref:30S ribosomal protein S1 n=5 Tax=Pseudomonadota TaxID=1224 RepID=Q7VZG0_BORPE|nr:30S ribosomal protein S1 [Bordetella pertussis]AWP59692.1 30S ribosomal protein S1 [Bordetella bronchiseptica]PNO95296.1 30S ribosomal protein S1 [Bordetella pertussis 18323]CAE41252.1 30S ribosomal protein S1 [Bordetella pertussis Tohama I]CCJ60011.1 30S ribosomal protein S1 [Bordetella bronchiseptica MO149]CCN06379.1 30S ribosomal protein S1 [Bordetella bronchiseptica Bbr77]CCN17167.1 30S ribosomal protein S1 [Bordetella bronchiseptica MO211]
MDSNLMSSVSTSAILGGENFADLFAESLKSQDMKSGEVISAEVVRVDHNFVVVNAGLKSEALIPLEEFLNDQGELEVQPGDFVSVAIDSLENGYGDTILSRDRAKRLSAWLQLEQALENGELVTGTITGKVKGGLTVMTNGIRAFLPGSLVDLRPVKDTTPYEGKTLEFKVIKLDRKRNNVVLSRRQVLEASMGEERQKLLETLHEGAVVKGVVKNITDYGAFVDLGGIDGLLHITDMAWRRVRHPSEVLQVGQEVEAKVLKFDQEKSRVSLGVKQLGEDPWVGLARRYPQGTRLFGKVTNLTDYGAFVEVEAGIEGLVHVSEMDWTNKNVDPRKVVTLGEEVEVMVLEIDEDRRRISLGMKQCRQNPWEEFATNFKRGDKVRGAIKSITDFGVFVGLPGGIDGLVHLSDLSWTESGEEAVRNFKKGDELEAVVLGIDTEKERISLGIKQLEGDPFNNFVATHDKGAVVPGTIKSVEPKGAVITLSVDVEGYLRASEISSGRVEDATTVLKAGENIEAMIVNIDRKARSIQLSIKARDNAETAETIQRMSEASASSGTTNLGALLKAKLDQQRNDG